MPSEALLRFRAHAAKQQKSVRSGGRNRRQPQDKAMPIPILKNIGWHLGSDKAMPIPILKNIG